MGILISTKNHRKKNNPQAPHKQPKNRRRLRWSLFAMRVMIPSIFDSQ
jgi:hypothetical protein